MEKMKSEGKVLAYCIGLLLVCAFVGTVSASVIEEDAEDSYSFFSSGPGECVDIPNAVDENWDTYAYSQLSQLCAVYENYDIPTCVDSAKWTTKISVAAVDPFSTSVRCYNHDTSSWTTMLTLPGIVPLPYGAIHIETIDIPSGCLNGDQLKIETWVRDSPAGDSRYYEGKVTWKVAISVIEEDAEDSYSCLGVFLDTFPCSSAVDEDWGSYAYCGDPKSCDVTEYYDIPTCVDSAKWTTKIGVKIFDPFSTSVRCYNYDTSSWTTILTLSGTEPMPYTVYTETIDIPSGCLNGDQLKIETWVRDFYAGDSRYYEGKVTWKVSTTVESSDDAGKKKDTFLVGDKVYAYGSCYEKNKNYDLYIVEDRIWNDEMAIPPFIVKATVSTDANGKIFPHPTRIWDSAEIGKYDIIVDVDGNGKYNTCTDPLDNMDVNNAGFEVIPEFATIAIPVAAIIGLLFLFSGRKRKE